MSAPAPRSAPATDPRVIAGFINWAHALDHYVILIFPTAVLAIGPELGLAYGEMIGLSTACFVAFGVFALPAGWLGDHWSRRNMIALFFIGCGVSLIATGLAYSQLALTISMLSLGVFAAIYHPVGTTMLIAVAVRRGQSLALNGVAGNLGAALAAAGTAAIAAFFGWRAAFIVPGIVCAISGFAFLYAVSEPRGAREQRTSRPEVPIEPKLMVLFVSLFAVAVLLGGLLFTAVTVSLPKIVDERMGDTSLPIMLIGSLATAVFICGAATQLVVGRLVERYKPVGVFVGTSILQLIGLAVAWASTGIPMLVGLAVAMAGIYGQITVNDVVVARFTADAWRGKVYAVRFFLGFGTAGLAVAVIGYLHEHGGFGPVFQVMIGMAAAFVVVIAWIALMAYRMEARAAALPAE